MIFVLLVLLRIIQFYSYLLVVFALLSWFPGAYNTWLGRVLTQLVDPILRSVRRSFNFQFMGLDFTIVIVLIALNVISHILTMIFM